MVKEKPSKAKLGFEFRIRGGRIIISLPDEKNMLIALSLLPLLGLAQDLNKPYTGPFGRIERGGKNLWENGRIWKFNSVNCPTMHTIYYPIGRLYGFNTCQRKVANVGTNVDGNGYVYGNEWGQTCIVPKSGDRIDYSSWVPRAPVPQEQEDLLMSVRGAGGKVIRSYTIGLGPGYHISAPNTFTEEVSLFNNCLVLGWFRSSFGLGQKTRYPVNSTNPQCSSWWRRLQL